MSEELPKQELLIKLLALTASDSEGEALSAMRKANSLLATSGWTWEKLIHGKIKVFEDPFKNLSTPVQRPMARTAPAPPSPPPPQQRPSWMQKSQQSSATPRATRPPPPRYGAPKKGPDISDL